MTTVLTGGANGGGNSMFYVLAKEGSSGLAVKGNLDCTNAVVANIKKECGRAICKKS